MIVKIFWKKRQLSEGTSGIFDKSPGQPDVGLEGIVYQDRAVDVGK
jgi:hypothetical protein